MRVDSGLTPPNDADRVPLSAPFRPCRSTRIGAALMRDTPRMTRPTDSVSGRNVTTFCRICNAMCGLIVTVSDDMRITEVRGDTTHPLSKGYTCPKGRAVGALHHDPDRLDHPLLGRDPNRHQVGWSSLLDDLAAALIDIVERSGPDAVAMYLASGSAFDTAGRRMAERFLSALGSRQKYTATTIDTPCKPLVAEMVGGWSGLTPVWDHRAGSLLVLIGTNPVVSHGHSNAIPDPVRRLREFSERGGTVWVVDPRRTATAELADHHLQIRAGTDWLVLAWLVQQLLADDERRADASRRAEGVEVLHRAVADLDQNLVADLTGIPPETLGNLLADVVAAGRLCALTGTGTTMTTTANVTEFLLWALMVITDSHDREGGTWFNPGFLTRLDTRDLTGAASSSPPPTTMGPPSRPELPRRFGEWPVSALITEIESGSVEALLVIGGSPMTAFPDSVRLERALRDIPVLAVADILPTATTELATHVLPAVDQLERADLTWLLDTYQLEVAAQYTDAAVPPRHDRAPVWRMMLGLADRMGLELLPPHIDPTTVDERRLLDPLIDRSVDPDALRRSPTGVVHTGPVFGWVHDRVLPDGRWNLDCPPLLEQLGDALLDAGSTTHEDRSDAMVLIPHRRLRMMNSQLRRIGAPGGRLERPDIGVHPQPARTLGIGEGDPVTVRSRHGSLVGIARLDPTLDTRSVTITHGVDDCNVSNLTSSEIDIDPLTGMVRQGTLPVEISAGPPRSNATARDRVHRRDDRPG